LDLSRSRSGRGIPRSPLEPETEISKALSELT
jgi:hypothetical protein